MTIKKLIELVRDHGGKDVELVILVREGAVHYAVHKTRRTRASLSEILHPPKAKQMAAGRATGKDEAWRDQDVDYAASEIISDLAESALAQGVELHWNHI